MLTKNDLAQIGVLIQTETRKIVQEETRKIVQEETRKIVQEETRKIVHEELAPVKNDISSVKKELNSVKIQMRKNQNAIIKFFDEETNNIKLRLDKVEANQSKIRHG